MKSKKDIPKFNKISAEATFKIDRFKKSVRKTISHKHDNHLEMIFLTQGSGVHHIDGVAYPIHPPIFFLIRREQVHSWEMESEPKGYVIILKRDFLSQFLDSNIRTQLFELSNQNMRISFSKKEQNRAECILDMAIEEYNHHSLNKRMMGGLFQCFFEIILTSQSGQTESKPIRQYDSGGADGIYRKFLELLHNQDNSLRNNVSYYAKILHISPQLLNQHCQKEAGESASKIIADAIILEAKRLLLYTELSVREIGNLLNFNDDSHFVKYFKKYTNQTPVSYRNSSSGSNPENP